MYMYTNIVHTVDSGAPLTLIIDNMVNSETNRFSGGVTPVITNIGQVLRYLKFLLILLGAG